MNVKLDITYLIEWIAEEVKEQTEIMDFITEEEKRSFGFSSIGSILSEKELKELFVLIGKEMIKIYSK